MGTARNGIQGDGCVRQRPITGSTALLCHSFVYVDWCTLLGYVMEVGADPQTAKAIAPLITSCVGAIVKATTGPDKRVTQSAALYVFVARESTL